MEKHSPVSVNDILICAEVTPIPGHTINTRVGHGTALSCICCSHTFLLSDDTTKSTETKNGTSLVVVSDVG